MFNLPGLFCCPLPLSLRVAAQTTNGSISGRVTDPPKATITDAKVRS
jgi:hypothetical protein